ncbi:MAG TPA: enoyl-CoA hydratase-related protein [Thermomicrobiales bacterium]|nr:enoyl-CoA hydratase-related protein [Thermomicrobiales bacterium]
MSVDVSVSEQVATITIANPERHNALDTAHLTDLLGAVRTVAEDASVRAIVLTGAGERAFVAGANIKEMAKLSPADAMAFGRLGHAAGAAIERAPQPVIAAVNGFALGGGCEIALACDIRIAATNAVFAQPEVGLGIPPGWGGSQRMPRLVGKGIASELIFTGRHVKAEEALRIGLVNAVYEPEHLMDEARKLAEAIAKNSPAAVRLSKRLIARAEDAHPSAGLAEEAHAFAGVFGSHDQREGMDAFLEKRSPVFSDEPRAHEKGN